MSKKKDLLRRFTPSTTLSFIDSRLVRRIEKAFRDSTPSGDENTQMDFVKFIQLVWDLAISFSDLRKGEEASFVQALAVLFMEASRGEGKNSLEWAKIIDFFIDEQMREGKLGDANESNDGHAGTYLAPRYNVQKIADITTHKGGVSQMAWWKRWGLILCCDRNYSGVKVYDPYELLPMYNGDLPFFAYNASGGSLITRTDVTCPNYIQNFCTPPNSMDVLKGSKLKDSRIMGEFLAPPKGSFPVGIAIDARNDTIGVAYSSRHLAFWTVTSAGLRLDGIYAMDRGCTGIFYSDSARKWLCCYQTYDIGVYSLERLFQRHGYPKTFDIVPSRKRNDPEELDVAHSGTDEKKGGDSDKKSGGSGSGGSDKKKDKGGKNEKDGKKKEEGEEEESYRSEKIITTILPQTLLKGHLDQVTCIIDISNFGVASASFDRNIVLWDSVTFSQLKRITCGCGIRCIAYNHHFSFLLTVGFTPEASIYPTSNLTDGSTSTVIQKCATLRGHVSGLTSCAFMGRYVAITADDIGFIRLWDLRDYVCYQLITPQQVGFNFWNLLLVDRLEEGFRKQGHLGRGSVLTDDDRTMDADFVIGGERLAKVYKKPKPTDVDASVVIFAKVCHLNQTFIVVTEQSLFGFDMVTGNLVNCRATSLICREAEQQAAILYGTGTVASVLSGGESDLKQELKSLIMNDNTNDQSKSSSDDDSPIRISKTTDDTDFVDRFSDKCLTRRINIRKKNEPPKKAEIREQSERCSEFHKYVKGSITFDGKAASTIAAQSNPQLQKSLAAKKKYGSRKNRENKNDFSLTHSEGFNFKKLENNKNSPPEPKRPNTAGSPKGKKGGKKGKGSPRDGSPTGSSSGYDSYGNNGISPAGKNTTNKSPNKSAVSPNSVGLSPEMMQGSSDTESSLDGKEGQRPITAASSDVKKQDGKKPNYEGMTKQEVAAAQAAALAAKRDLLQDNENLTKTNFATETISAACFDAAQARIIFGTDKGKIYVTDCSFSPLYPRLKMSHDKQVTHVLYVPPTTSNMGYYRYYDYNIRKKALMEEYERRREIVQDYNAGNHLDKHIVQTYEYETKNPLHIPVGLIITAGSDGYIRVLEDNPQRGFPPNVRFQYSTRGERLKGLYFDTEATGYLISITDTQMSYWEIHGLQTEPVRTFRINAPSKSAISKMSDEIPKDIGSPASGIGGPAGLVGPGSHYGTAGHIIRDVNLGMGRDAGKKAQLFPGSGLDRPDEDDRSAKRRPSGILEDDGNGFSSHAANFQANTSPQMMLSETRANSKQPSLLESSLNTSEFGTKVHRWKNFRNDLAFLLDATSGEIMILNALTGQIEECFLHQKVVVHNDNLYHVNFPACSFCVLEERPAELAHTYLSTGEPDEERDWRRGKSEPHRDRDEPRKNGGRERFSLSKFPYFEKFKQLVEDAVIHEFRSELPDGMIKRISQSQDMKYWNQPRRDELHQEICSRLGAAFYRNGLGFIGADDDDASKKNDEKKHGGKKHHDEKHDEKNKTNTDEPKNESRLFEKQCEMYEEDFPGIQNVVLEHVNTSENYIAETYKFYKFRDLLFENQPAICKSGDMRGRMGLNPGPAGAVAAGGGLGGVPSLGASAGGIGGAAAGPTLIPNNNSNGTFMTQVNPNDTVGVILGQRDRRFGDQDHTTVTHSADSILIPANMPSSALTAIEKEAGAALEADLGHVEELLRGQLKQYLQDPDVLDTFATVLERLDDQFGKEDAKEGDEEASGSRSVTMFGRSTIMGEEEGQADDQETRRLKEPDDLAERTRCLTEEAKTYLETGGANGKNMHFGGMNQSCIMILASATGEISLLRLVISSAEQQKQQNRREGKMPKVSPTGGSMMGSTLGSASGTANLAAAGQSSRLASKEVKLAGGAKGAGVGGKSGVGAAAGSTDSSQEKDTNGVASARIVSHSYGNLIVEKETLVTWKAHSGKITYLQVISGINAVISCGDTGDVKIWPLDLYFGTDGRNVNDKLDGLSYYLVSLSNEEWATFKQIKTKKQESSASAAAAVATGSANTGAAAGGAAGGAGAATGGAAGGAAAGKQGVNDRVKILTAGERPKKVVRCDAVYYKKPWCKLHLNAKANSGWYLPDCLRHSCCYRLQSWRTMQMIKDRQLQAQHMNSSMATHAQGGNKLLARQAAALFLCTTMNLYDRYYDEKKIIYEQHTEHKRKAEQKLKEKSKGISLMTTNTVNQSYSSQMEPESLRAVTVFQEMIHARQTPIMFLQDGTVAPPGASPPGTAGDLKSPLKDGKGGKVGAKGLGKSGASGGHRGMGGGAQGGIGGMAGGALGSSMGKARTGTAPGRESIAFSGGSPALAAHGGRKLSANTDLLKRKKNRGKPNKPGVESLAAKLSKIESEVEVLRQQGKKISGDIVKTYAGGPAPSTLHPGGPHGHHPSTLHPGGHGTKLTPIVRKSGETRKTNLKVDQSRQGGPQGGLAAAGRLASHASSFATSSHVTQESGMVGSDFGGIAASTFGGIGASTFAGLGGLGGFERPDCGSDDKKRDDLSTPKSSGYMTGEDRSKLMQLDKLIEETNILNLTLPRSFYLDKVKGPKSPERFLRKRYVSEPSLFGEDGDGLGEGATPKAKDIRPDGLPGSKARPASTGKGIREVRVMSKELEGSKSAAGGGTVGSKPSTAGGILAKDGLDGEFRAPQKVGQYLSSLEQNVPRLRRKEGKKPSRDTRWKFPPEVNDGRSFAVTGGDVRLNFAEPSKLRTRAMKAMLLNQFPRRSVEVEIKLLEMAKSPNTHTVI